MVEAKPAPTKPQAMVIKAAREDLQALLGLGITAAQDLCAQQVHTQRRCWQHWERGEREMHPAFWELFGIKSQALINAAQGAQ